MDKTQRKLRSDEPFGVSWAERRALLKGLGLTDNDLAKPQVAIISSWSSINPGHVHLNELADYVEKGVKEAGGTPHRFNTIGLCDGIALVGAEYILPSRDLIKHEVEVIVEAYKMDAVVMLATCDKIVPAYCMAAAMLDIPAVVVTGGYMKNGSLNGQRLNFIDVGRAVGKATSNLISMEECNCVISNACGQPGACGMMGTANTMCIVAEALGLSLPGNSTMAAVSQEIRDLATEAGRKVMELWDKGITARQIVTEKAVQNAIDVCMAVGGSSNSVVHIPGIAGSAELDMDVMDYLDKASTNTPLVLGVEPNGPYTMEEFDAAGGLKALEKQIAAKLNLDALTVTGKTLGENIADAQVKDAEIIHDLEHPLSNEGALCVLRGNLAPDGAVVKQSAVCEEMLAHRGPARVFNSNEEAIEGLRNGTIKPGDVVIIRFCGAKGGPGLITTFMFTSELAGSSLNGKVALITDGRFSGATEGPCIGYASPEAAAYGPLLIVQNDDMINYDINKRSMMLELSDEEIKNRLDNVDLNIDIKKGYMGVFQRCVGSVLKGAIVDGRNK